MERKNLKILSNLLSKTAGLVFFSFLAISLGVVFGLLFDGWVKDQPGAPVDAKNSLETVEMPIVSEANPTLAERDSGTAVVGLEQVPQVRYKVRVGPYAKRESAVSASEKLQQQGYPVFVGKNPPFAIQVGAFSTKKNAEKLKTELSGKGYKSFIEK
jgi:cell division septation protein DedD